VIEVSPAKRSRIIQEVHADPDKKWAGTVGGHKAEIRIEDAPVGLGLKCGNAATFVRWRVCVSRRWHEGVAVTVWDALVAMGGPFPFSFTGRKESEPAARLFEERIQ
jgi:hypothetical protein